MFETAISNSIETPIEHSRAPRSDAARAPLNASRAPSSGDEQPSVERVLDLLAQADRLNALAVLRAASLRPGAIEAATGLPTETTLRLHAGRTRWEAAELARLAELVGAMPQLACALEEGIVSFSQARAIARECKGLSRAALATIDTVVGTHASRLATAEPEELLVRVEDAAASLRADAALRREERQVRTGFLWLQPRLEGGGAMYGEADTEAFATIAGALESACARPEGELPRAHQRMDALAGICAGHLSGTTSGRARPRFLATVASRTFSARARASARAPARACSPLLPAGPRR